MKTINPNSYFTTSEVKKVLDRNPMGYRDKRESCILKAFMILQSKHGYSANISDSDVCDYLHTMKWHLSTN